MQIAMRYAAHQEEAKELLNLAFVRIVYQIHKYNPEQPFAYWMHRVAVNVIIDHFRAEKRYRSLQQTGENYASLQAATQWLEPDSQLVYADLLNMIRQLPAATAHVFNLYAVDGFKHREIAEMLGISENTSKWHVNQARIQLQAMLKDHQTVRHA
jgi:RNA polymerase sigma-70 factor (ECF subfamily)